MSPQFFSRPAPPTPGPADRNPALITINYHDRPELPHSRVVASWSGGIDSTAVIAHLLTRGYDVRAVTLGIYVGSFGEREREARAKLMPHFDAIARANDCEITYSYEPASWIWAFSPDGIEIPRRNKHIIDHLVTAHAMRKGIKNIALGEYTGADTWLVRNHVAGNDADHRALASYLYAEYGIEWRLISLQDFGESRYKRNRVRLLRDIMGDAAELTSVCLVDAEQHCGECYKCVERHAAFMLEAGRDGTIYLKDPAQHSDFHLYRKQMEGFDFTADHSNFPTHHAMPSARGAG